MRLLCNAAAKFGISEEACLENTSIKVEDLDDASALHSTNDEIIAIENLVRLAPENVGLGYGVGMETHVHAFGIWGFAILTSPTVRAALETSINYAKLSYMIAEMRIVERDGLARLELDTSGLPVSTHRYIMERHMVIAVKFIREVMQSEYDQFEAWLIDDDESYPEKLQQIGAVPIKMGQSVNALVFPSDILDVPLPKSDPASLQFCLNQCKALLEEQDGALPHWSQQVRDAIVDDIGKEQNIERIAAKLAVTERTLRRRLSDESTSFRQIYIDARMGIAYELLSSAGLNVETVSWRVGYSEPASFARAFTKKYNRSPGEVRKESRARAS